MAAHSEYPTQDQVDARLPVEGYVLLKSPLTENQRAEIVKSLTDQVLYQVYGRKGIQFDYNNHDHVQPLVKALSDKNHRENILGSLASDTVWRKDNTRDPVWSKSTGMINIHYNQSVLSNISLNPEVYATLAHYYNYPKLAHKVGLEKVCFKAPESTLMEQHIDTNLFDDSVNYPCRLQSLICLQVDTKIKPENSGTIEVLEYFHLYWYLARALFHPITGPCPWPKEGKSGLGNRYHLLPKDFDSKYLPALHYHIQHYTAYYHSNQTPPEGWNQVYQVWREMGITVPQTIYLPLWKSVRPSWIIWSSRLPHRSRGNKSDITRIAAYISLFPVDDSWYGTAEQEYLIKQIKQCHFYYNVNHGVYNTTLKNPEEYEYLVGTDQISAIQDLLHRSQISRQLVGLEKY